MIDLNQVSGERLSLVSRATPANKYSVELIGSFRNQVVLVSWPDGLSREGGVRVGQCFHLRFSRNNVIQSWQTKVVRLCSEPYLCLALVSPDAGLGAGMNAAGAREARLTVKKKEISIALFDGENQSIVSVADISLSGARLVSNHRLGSVGDVFYIDLTLSHSANSIRLPCKIRYIRSEISIPDNYRGDNIESAKEQIYHHGVEFSHLSENNETFLLRFVG